MVIRYITQNQTSPSRKMLKMKVRETSEITGRKRDENMSLNY